MSESTSRARAALRAFFAVDDDWERPAPTARQQRNDLWIAVGVWALAAVGMELVRSLVDPRYAGHPWWVYQLLVLAGTIPLAWRRRWPLTVMCLLQLHFFFTGMSVPEVPQSFTMQCVYVFAIFTGVGWARSRRVMLAVVGGILVLMFGWVAWQYALGSAVQELYERVNQRHPQGVVPPIVAAVLFDALMNLAYFGGGIVGGQAAWRQARSRQQLHEQASQLAEQADELADRKVVEERLRIARELHDVVAHHISVMGVQAAAARRVLDRNPEAAAVALSEVESSSRQAVGEMRGLLGTLRRTDARGPSDAAADGGDRAPQPGVDQIAMLVHESSSAPGFSATYEVVEDRPGALTEVPMPVGLSLYRTVQEALANVRRHSTAHRATVVLRIGTAGEGRYVEAEVLDEGRPRGGTSGSGLGLLGMRERIASHGGTSEIGPRATGGYRVRVRFPLPERF